MEGWLMNGKGFGRRLWWPKEVLLRHLTERTEENQEKLYPNTSLEHRLSDLFKVR
jgi:hypothetical protein